MKKIFILVMGALFFVPVFGQQMPDYSLLHENNFVLNPAIAGSENHGIAMASFRQQWTKIKGAPQTFTASYRSPIRKTNLGIGAEIINDRSGPTSETGVTFAAAYHISFEKIHPFRWNRFLRESKISIGLSASIVQYRLNSNELILDQPNDMAINTIPHSKWLPNAGLGIYYYYDKFFLGFSVPNVIPFNVTFADQSTISNIPRALHYYVVVGGKIPLGAAYKPKFTLEPMIWFRAVANAPFQVDANLRFKYKKLFWVGLGYRSKNSLMADVGVMIKDQFQISYAYDQMASDAFKYTSGSHELVLGYHLPAHKRYKRYN